MLFRSTLTINDTAANIASNATALQTLAAALAQDAYGSVGQSNNNSLTLTINDSAANIARNASTLQTLAAALAKDAYASVGQSNNNSLTLTITDTAANIASNATALQTLAAALAKDTYGSGSSNNNSLSLTINDTAANIASNAVALNALTAKLSQDIYGSGKNNDHLTITITDTLSHVLTSINNLNSLSAAITGITLTDNSVPSATLSTSQYSTDTALLAKISMPYTLNISGELAANVSVDAKNSHVTSMGVLDTAAHVAVNLDGVLEANVAKLSTITLTDGGTPTLALTTSQVLNDISALGKIGSQYSITLTDTTPPTLSIAASQLVQDTPVLGKISTAYKLALTDQGSPSIVLTASQFSQDTALLAKISTPYSLSISGELAASIATDVKNSHVTSIAVADTAAHVSTNLDSLKSNLGKLYGITLTDPTPPALSLTAAQVTSDLGVLNAISSPYLLSVKDTVANLNSLALDGVQDSQIEIMPTSLLATLTENTQITDLNLSQINLTGDSITEKAYQTTGTEVDIVTSKGAVANQLFFTHDTEAQLHLLGIGTTVVHVM